MRGASHALLVILAILGLADSVYLAEAATTGAPLVCDFGSVLEGCNVVAASPYSQFYGIPLAYLGVLFYVLLLIAILVHRNRKTLLTWKALVVVAILGALFSVAFLYIQFVLIKALCVYCLASAAFTFLAVPLSFKQKPVAAPVLP